jgi:hypothetical protein
MNRLMRAAVVISFTLATALPMPVGANTILSPFKHEAVSVNVKPGWRVAAKFADKGMFLLQLVPPDADPKNPSTLINIVTYANSTAVGSAKDYAKREQAGAPKLAGSGKIDFKFTDDSNPNDVTYELTSTGVPKFADQFEVHRVIKGKDGVHAIIYHVQPATQTREQVAEMHELLKQVKLVDTPKDASKTSHK